MPLLPGTRSIVKAWSDWSMMDIAPLHPALPDFGVWCRISTPADIRASLFALRMCSAISGFAFSSAPAVKLERASNT